MSVLQKANLLFISFEEAAHGHRLARVLSCLKNVYWYSHKDNGICPWNILQKSSKIPQRKFAKGHFNRIMPSGKMLPPPYDYVKDYFTDPKIYYETIFTDKFIEAGGEAVSINTYIPYCTQSSPYHIQKHFPNARIINVIHDPIVCAARYLNLSFKFPGFVRHKTVVPDNNTYLSWLNSLKKQKPNFSLADKWAQKKYSTWFEERMMEEYKACIFEFYETQYAERKGIVKNNVLNVTVRDYKKIKDFLGAQ